MPAVIIRQDDVDRLASTLLKEMFEFLHDEYILKGFEIKMKLEKIFLIKFV